MAWVGAVTRRKRGFDWRFFDENRDDPVRWILAVFAGAILGVVIARWLGVR